MDFLHHLEKLVKIGKTIAANFLKRLLTKEGCNSQKGLTTWLY